MKLNALAAALAVLVIADSARADVFVLGPLDNVSVAIGAAHIPGAFVDFFMFSISSIGLGVGATISITVDVPEFPGPESNISFAGLAFLDSTNAVIATDFDGSDGWVLAALLPTGGNYAFAVAGIADGSSGGAYGGALGTFVPTPVPEPHTYGLLLAGLGVVGFAARRRRPE